MTNEELVQKIQSGDKTQIESLWNNVERLIRMLAKKFIILHNRQHDDVEDYVQSGYLAMIKAINSYDPGEGVLFTTHLSSYLRNEFNEVAQIRSVYRGAFKISNVAVSIETPIADGLNLGDTIQDPKDYFEDPVNIIYQEQLHRTLESILQEIPEEYSGVIRERFWENNTIEQIAEKHHCKAEKVKKQHDKGMRMMRHYKYRKRLTPYEKDFLTPFYRRVGLGTFNTTGLSSVEEIVMIRQGLT